MKHTIAFALAITLTSWVAAQSSSAAASAADQVAMITDGLRQECPTGIAVALGGPDYRPSCLVLEYHDQSIARMALDVRVSIGELGAWLNPWELRNMGSTPVATRVLGLNDTGFAIFLWPFGDYHTLVVLHHLER